MCRLYGFRSSAPRKVECESVKAQNVLADAMKPRTILVSSISGRTPIPSCSLGSMLRVGRSVLSLLISKAA